MKHISSKRLFEYWNELRGTRPAPNRDEIQPSGLRHILGDAYILQDEPRFQASFRLCGNNVNHIFCRELKGQRFLGLFADESQTAVQTLWRSVAEEQAAVVMGTIGHSNRGKQVRLETLMLPLNVSSRQGYRVLATTAAFDKPYWLGVDPVTQQTVDSVRIVMPDDIGRLGNGAPSLQTPTGPVAALALAGDGARRYGHLVVVDGGNLAD
ncbi:MAG: PAS domain-containing protein [Pseudomonadota bacterium]